MNLSPAHTDVEVARLTGLPLAAVQAQLARLRGPLGGSVVALSPARMGEGICAPEPAPERVAAALDGGRVMQMVPGSGAATRLLADLGAWLETGGAVPAELTGWRCEAALGPDAPRDPVARAEALMGGAHHRAPKLLWPFHLVGGRPQTALERQHAELLACFGGRLPLVVTVGPEWVQAVQALGMAEVLEQAAETECLVLRLSGELRCEPDGRPMCRPGGHGALLAHLQGRDVVLLRNVDNVAHPDHAGAQRQARQDVLGTLLRVEAEVHGVLAGLDAGAPGALLRAQAVAWHRFGLTGLRDVATARAALWRPLRVAGVVPAGDHEGGGGAYWVRDLDGRRCLGVVEAAELGDARLGRAPFLHSAELACSVRDHVGVPYRLADFADANAWIVTERDVEGELARTIEYPGLWNGGMARWNTVFIALPPASFTPVKRLSDLAAPAHGPAV